MDGATTTADQDGTTERGDTADPLDLATRIAAWLAEDRADRDCTALALVAPEVTGMAAIRAQQAGILAGLDVARQVLLAVDPAIGLEARAEDGVRLDKGEVVAFVTGRCRSLLAGERTALNVLQRMSGIATLTAQYVHAVRGTGVAILATRKTNPGLRDLDVLAVRAGGGDMHRLSLADQVLVKENHLRAMRRAGDATSMADLVARLTGEHAPGVPVGVEVTDLGELRDALAPGIDIVLLDNFTPARCAEAVRMRDAADERSRPALEASGGITLDTVRAFAASGVDRISVGALTHSARSLDLNMKIVPDEKTGERADESSGGEAAR